MKLTHHTIETGNGTTVIDTVVTVADPLICERRSKVRNHSVRNSNVTARRRVLLA